ncbi:MAG: metallophosphoesterase family protein [Candidatus Brocadiales bacterium]
MGDIHSNLEALNTVLKDIERQGTDKLLSIGDVVGYAAEPSSCLAALRNSTDTIVAGNHDFAAAGKMNIDYFNPHAREAVLWTRAHLSDKEQDFLSNLPLTIELDKEDITLVHSTLYEPDQFHYLHSYNDAEACFSLLKTFICFLGHSHVPAAVLKDADGSIRTETKEEVSLKDAKQAIINVGSVGQPRDKDPRACYVLYDTDAALIRFRRLEYDIDAASKKIREAGLPEIEAERLRHGY